MELTTLEILTQKLVGVFDKLGRKGKLSEGDIDDALRQVRLALLEVDVNFKVVKEEIVKLEPNPFSKVGYAIDQQSLKLSSNFTKTDSYTTST